jgi:uncharacterized protein (TIGR02246 family)
MNRLRKIVFPLAALLFVSCGTRTSSGLSAAAEAEIRTQETDWLRAAQDGNAPGFASFYAEDASFMPPNGPAAHGGPAIRKAIEDLFAAGLILSIETSKLVAASSGDLAYSQGRYTATLNNAQGKPVEDTGKFVLVFRKRDGAWKIVADIFNSDLPAAPSAN